ncbi:exostosin family protein [Carex rostrata]
MAKPIPIPPPLLFLFLSSLSITTSLADSCAGRRIHILPLPPRFNSDLLLLCNASFLALSDSQPFCEFVDNHFLGPRILDRFPCWFRTEPRFLEPFFYHRLLSTYPCLSASAADADAIFLPYYASLDALPFLYSPPLFNSSSLHGLALYQYLHSNHPQVLSRHHGHDIFLILAGVAWDYNQNPEANPVSWGTSFLRRPEFVNFTMLTLDSRPWPWQEHAIPHMTSFHPSSLPRLNDWLFRAARSIRTTLMLFAGGRANVKAAASPTSRPNIRSTIISQCANRTDLCTLVDCSAGVCTNDPLLSIVPMLKSKFCLQPPSDTPTRRSAFSSIIAGCIPVFFEVSSAKKPYGWHLPKSRYDEFSVFIPKEEVVFGGVHIADVLEAIPEEKVRRMRERVLEMAPRVMYMEHGGGDDFKGVKDAFDLAIDGVLRRLQRRVEAIKEGDPNQIYFIDDDEEDQKAFGF